MIQLDLSWIQCKTQKEAGFLNRIQSLTYQTTQYQDETLKKLALNSIPVDSIHEKAKISFEKQKDTTSYKDEVVKQLLSWFKSEYFTWVNTLPCDFCKGATTLIGSTQPNQEERKYHAGVVEVYKCNTCQQQSRFPRYNHVAALLKSRKGRCGEWAQCFTMCCTAMGFDARYVMDWTDHVWTEVYSDHLKRWIHCDSCENKFDTPLLYEQGWGKKLSYVIAFCTEQVVDVTKRYTKNYKDVLSRRTDVSEEFLENALKNVNYQLDIFKFEDRLSICQKRFIEEEKELNSSIKIENLNDLEGRISGSQEWKESRGETGKNKVFKCTTVDFSSIKLDHSTFFKFTTFKNCKDYFTFVKNGSIEGDHLRITQAKNDQNAAIWYKDKLTLDQGFSSAFQFKATKNGADGFAFVIQADGPNVIGKPGSGLGYEGIKDSIAIEFDTYENRDSSDDPTNNHISVQTKEFDNSAHHKYSLCCTSDIPQMNDGNVHTVKINYMNKKLEIFFDDLEKSILSCNIEMKKSAWIGFTGSTGGLNQCQEILNWSFNIPDLDDKNIYRFTVAKVEHIVKKLKSTITKNKVDFKNIELLDKFEKIKKEEISGLIELLNQLIKDLPEKEVFPVLDLVRLIVLNEEAIDEILKNKDGLQKTLIGLMESFKSLSDPSKVMIMRFWCNLLPEKLKSFKGIDFIHNQMDLCVKLLQESFESDSLPLKFVSSCLASNLSLIGKNDNSDTECQMVVTLIETLKQIEKLDEQTIDKIVLTLYRFRGNEDYVQLIGALSLDLNVVEKKTSLKSLIQKLK